MHSYTVGYVQSSDSQYELPWECIAQQIVLIGIYKKKDIQPLYFAKLTNY